MINLKVLLADHQTGHSEFQDDYLITTRAGGTTYGCYKQSLRELYKRLRGLRELTCDRDILKIEIGELNSSDKAKDKVEYRRKTMQMEEADRVIRDTEREFVRFYQQALFLKEKIGELTEEKRAKLDREMWAFKLKEMAALDYQTSIRLSQNTLTFLMSLPKSMRMELLDECQPSNKDALVKWYHNVEEVLIPKDFPKLEFNQKLLEML